MAREAGLPADNVHHLLAKYVARKYHIDPRIVKCLDNALGVDFLFHEEINKYFTEEDYIFIGVSLLGLSYDDFAPKRKGKRK